MGLVDPNAYLRANGFETYIVSGGGIECMRPWTEKVYGVPPEAAMDYHAALTAGDKYAPIACPGTQVTREEVVVVLRECAKDNSQSD